MRIAYNAGGRPLSLELEESGDGLRIRVGEDPEALELEQWTVDERYVTLRTAGRSVRLLYAKQGAHVHVAAAGESYEFIPAEEAEEDAAEQGAFVAEVRSPMPGKVLAVRVAVGDAVEPDQPLLLLEAMKMEQTVRAPASARVAEVHVEAGQMVGPGAVLLLLEPLEDQTSTSRV